MKIRQTWVLAKGVFIENLRNQSFFFLGSLGIGILFVAVPISNMAVGSSQRVFQTYGFWIIGIWGLALALFFGVNIIKHELINRTIYLLLARPIERYVIVLGKCIGILGLITGLFFMMAMVFIAQLYLLEISVNTSFWVALGFIYFEWILLSFFSIFFSTFTSPVLHIFFLMGIYFMGHWSKYLYIYSQNMDTQIAKKILVVLYWLIPNLELLNFREAAIYGDTLDIYVIIKSFSVFFFWASTILMLSLAVFDHKRIS